METDLRYPIGKFHHPGTLTDGQRAEFMAVLEETPAKVRAAVKGLNEQQLNAPYRPGGWTVRQVVHHVPDSHMNAYVRFKLGLTEDEPMIKPYAEGKWAELADAKSSPVEPSLALLENLHKRWVLLLRSLRPAEWARKLRHPEWEKPMSLDEQLALYAWHGRHHVAHITALREREHWA
jgi:hypothetical protein